MNVTVGVNVSEAAGDAAQGVLDFDAGVGTSPVTEGVLLGLILGVELSAYVGNTEGGHGRCRGKQGLRGGCHHHGGSNMNWYWGLVGCDLDWGGHLDWSSYLDGSVMLDRGDVLDGFRDIESDAWFLDSGDGRS